MDLKEAKLKIGKYCAYQERSHQEVRDKLYTFGLHKADVEMLIVELIKMDYLNEERFARAYCRGKFLHNKWGKVKIAQGLHRKRISDYCIKKGMEEIKYESYIGCLTELLNKYRAKHQAQGDYIAKNKAARYAMQKGYEPNLIWELLNHENP